MGAEVKKASMPISLLPPFPHLVVPPLFAPFYSLVKEMTQGAGRVVDLPKKYTDTDSCVFWCKMTLGTTFTKGVLPVVGEPKSKKF